MRESFYTRNVGDWHKLVFTVYDKSQNQKEKLSTNHYINKYKYKYNKYNK